MLLYTTLAHVYDAIYRQIFDYEAEAQLVADFLPRAQGYST